MAFFFYFIVILLSAASVMFGLDLATSPLPRTPNLPIGRVDHTPPPAPIKQARDHEKRTGTRARTGLYSTGPGAPKGEVAQEATVGAASKHVSNKEWLPPARPPPNQQSVAAPIRPNEKNAAAMMASNATNPQDAGAQSAAAQNAALCNVEACDAAYRSFRASDCTYQPFYGPRRFCTKSSGGGTRSTPTRSRRYQESERVSRCARERHEIDTITTIVHQMMPSDQSDIAVQDSHGHIIIVRGGSARAYSGYDSDQ
jgi:hypothetical protein